MCAHSRAGARPHYAQVRRYRLHVIVKHALDRQIRVHAWLAFGEQALEREGGRERERERERERKSERGLLVRVIQLLSLLEYETLSYYCVRP